MTPLILQRPNPSPAGRRRQMNPFGQFLIGQAAIKLKLVKDAQFRCVQLYGFGTFFHLIGFNRVNFPNLSETA